MDRQSTIPALEEVDLTNCDTEPIHLSGHIQPHGVLLVVREPQLEILQVSENTQDLLGFDAKSAIGQNLSLLLDRTQLEKLKACLQKENLKTVNPIKLSLQRAGKSLEFDCILHRRQGILIIELELATTTENLSVFSFYHSVRATVSQIQSAKTLKELCQQTVEEIRKISGFDRVMTYQFDAEGNGAVIAEDKLQTLSPFLGLNYPKSDIPKQARKLYLLNWLRLIPDINYQPVPIIPQKNPVTNQSLDLSLSVLRSVSPIHIEYLQNMGVAATISISLIKDRQLWGLIVGHNYTPKYINYEVRAACEFIGQVMSLELQSKEANEDYDYKLHLKSIQTQIFEDISTSENLSEVLVKSQHNLLEAVNAQGAAIVFGEKCYRVGETPQGEALKYLTQWVQNSLKKEIFYTDSLTKYYPEAEEFKDTASGCLAIGISPSQKIYVLWFRPEVIKTVNWAGNPNKAVLIDEDGSHRLSPRKSFELWKENVRCKSSPWKQCEIDAALELKKATINIVLRQTEKLEKLNRALEASIAREREKSNHLKTAMYELQRTQTQLVQSERMSSLGQLVAAVAYEVTNPINFIYGNLNYAREYSQKMIDLLQLYEQHYPSPSPEIKAEIETAELEFIVEDLPRLLGSMKVGANRIREIVQSLRNFSRIDEAEIKEVDIHDGLDSALLILSNRLKPKPVKQSYPVGNRPTIHIIKEYGALPLVECYAVQINQVFMNVLTNALDALEDAFVNKKLSPHCGCEAEPAKSGQIRIVTEVCPGETAVVVRIKDNAWGMEETVCNKIFEPFFTTKPVGKGAGIGLAIGREIVVEQHGGKLSCISAPGEGTELIIEIPLSQTYPKPIVK
ncbi:MAG: GAF domain-containing protein [Microcoleus sp. PH2017_10_PVI_O_A]|uniref:ATP-binding protein n=1 Tax=unclassified Microcoleus TaxID=2642155 RepID=UPI001E198994|nr:MULTISPECIES: ATP-binding protein [unclassified Microcoleus]TAE77718.1 MAG: GAF domain-containing protein [Oscillatoriales cyanobacterium]MCC3409022.1 GAF domain-containing protein [Microcoleus sp. PH2017_10_PVI_O_A]MCC3463157.1 GAF domain-containing protein [Microcoleus sp. PH2017_11_PCY_U_A]MCC3481572.1 GAF domain-containing protein [Microcoleus sp. PH2017_12_PCY_D_A]MCC3531522.1 GAF domain-containing protein [Microcoleus sp. PH2017_21_RUC_O_A]